ncbi:hypothetical protein RHGRI_037530 [Rhododendron griersonianum]|uniref:GDSL esterase/lipase n=1 Tax=Rhododendron griersonianum TaxID=479676 RepID=A0AAV6HUU6_9ERIC|nr:hypothetical protein RHGRI_037530 [Rhododendron griersonianum]
MASSLFYLLLLVQVCSITAKRLDATKSPRFPAILIFGDSLLDTGNNNFIPTILKANHKPYGQDFPGKIPTGRFSNGKLVSDLLASALGIKDTVPPFLDPNLPQEELQTGVCFASAGSGYDDMTTVMSGVIPVSKQPEYLKQYIEKLKGATGEAKASDIINGSLVVVTSGSNDVTINYFSGGARRLQFPLIGGYHDFLLQRVQAFVKELYNQGCRNMLIAGLPPLGCWGAGFNMGGRCVDYSQSQSYNQKLVAMLSQLQESLPGSKLVYADFYTPLFDMMNNPQEYGKTSIFTIVSILQYIYARALFSNGKIHKRDAADYALRPLQFVQTLLNICFGIQFIQEKLPTELSQSIYRTMPFPSSHKVEKSPSFILVTQ